MDAFRLQGLQESKHLLGKRTVVEQYRHHAAFDLPVGNGVQA